MVIDIKQNTREQVKELRAKYPCYTLQSLANIAGVSKERVRQILASENLDTRHVAAYCRYCNAPLVNKSNDYCSPECQYKDTHIQISCSECGKLFWVYKSKFKYEEIKRGRKFWFCSNDCKGRWFGENHGWPKKYDSIKILMLYLENYTARQIKAMTGSSIDNIYNTIYLLRKKGLIIPHKNIGRTKLIKES